MDTVITMIVLTGMAVLFLSNVFRQVRDERERAQQRRVPPIRPTSSTEQFLEEVNRRRQQASERGKSAPPVRRITLTPAPSSAIRRETSARKAAAKVDRPRQVSVPARPTVRPVQMMEVLPADMSRDRIKTSVESTAAQPPEEQVRSGAVKVTLRPPPVLLAQLMPLLRSRQTLRAAFLLHEILGPPLCHHKRVPTR